MYLCGGISKYSPESTIRYINTLVQDNEVCFGSAYPGVTAERRFSKIAALPIESGGRTQDLDV